MLIIRYRTLKDLPGLAAGSVLEKDQASHVYRSGAYWCDQSVVEDSPDYTLHEVVESVKGVETPKFSADVDVAVKAQSDLAAQIAAIQDKLATVGTQLAGAVSVGVAIKG